MKNFEVPDMKVAVLTSFDIINNSNNEFALRIPSVEQAADLEE